ncbi:MAG: hypothetical protein KAW41_00930 [Candidatus Diapherotrites archaeon]|nr:hypothetical protein [Candidatus Diapherotrites archaeon]
MPGDIIPEKKTKTQKAIRALFAFGEKQRELPYVKTSRPGHLVARSMKRANELVEQATTIWEETKDKEQSGRIGPWGSGFKIIYPQDSRLRGEVFHELKRITRDLKRASSQKLSEEELQEEAARLKNFYTRGIPSGRTPEAEAKADAMLTDEEKAILGELGLDEDKYNEHVQHLASALESSHEDLYELMVHLIKEGKEVKLLK